MWIARNKEGQLNLFSIKPHRCSIGDFWFVTVDENGKVATWIKIDDSLFPNLKWEDEPIEVEIVSKRFMDMWRTKNKIMMEMSDEPDIEITDEMMDNIMN